MGYQGGCVGEQIVEERGRARLRNGAMLLNLLIPGVISSPDAKINAYIAGRGGGEGWRELEGTKAKKPVTKKKFKEKERIMASYTGRKRLGRGVESLRESAALVVMEERGEGA